MYTCVYNSVHACTQMCTHVYTTTPHTSATKGESVEPPRGSVRSWKAKRERITESVRITSGTFLTKARSLVLSVVSKSFMDMSHLFIALSYLASLIASLIG